MYVNVDPYAAALGAVLDALEADESLIRLSGPPGSGKSLLCLQLRSILLGRGYSVLYFPSSPTSVDGLYAAVRQGLGLNDHGILARELVSCLLPGAGLRKLLCLILDDAHLLGLPELEALRLLANTQDDAGFLVKVLLCGREELAQNLLTYSRSAGFRGWNRSIYLPPMSLEQFEGFQRGVQAVSRVHQILPNGIALIDVFRDTKGLPGPAWQRLTSLQTEVQLKPVNPLCGHSSATPPSALLHRVSRVTWWVGIGVTLCAVGLWALIGRSRTFVTPSDFSGDIDASLIPVRESQEESLTTAEVAASEAVETESASMEEIAEFLATWSSRWQSKDIEGYLALYHDDYQPPQEGPRSIWEQQRRRSIDRAVNIRITIDSLALVTDAGNLFKVQFRLLYTSDNYSDVTLKELELVKTEAGWQILAERNVLVTWVE